MGSYDKESTEWWKRYRKAIIKILNRRNHKTFDDLKSKGFAFYCTKNYSKKELSNTNVFLISIMGEPTYEDNEIIRYDL